MPRKLASVPSKTPIDPVASVQASVERIQRQIDALEANPEATSKEKTEAANALVAALRLLGKISGVTEVTPQMILRSPHWLRVQTCIVDALAKHPKALEDVTRVLERMAEANAA